MRLLNVPALVVLMICGASLAAQAESWPTKKFVLENLDPDSVVPFALQRPEPFTAEQEATIALYETYLTEVATEFEKMGFKAPRLPTVGAPGGQKTYRAFLFDYNDNESPARVTLLPDLTTEMWLDRSRSFAPKGGALPEIYEHLAHELFHAVQRAYQRSYDADLGNWIMEGQAQAVGMQLALDLRSIDVHADTAEDYRMGGRGYYRPLSQPLENKKAQPKQDEDYRTSGWWRYLAESYAASEMNKRAGVGPTRADYSLLHKLLSDEFKGPSSQNADLAWLDRALRNTTGLSLRRHFASFSSIVVDYMPVRMTREPKGSLAAAQQGWRELLFDGCPHTINLTATAPGGYDVVKLDRVAARCFRVKVFGEGKADVTVHIRTETPAAISSLLIGTAGGAQVGEPVIAPAPVGGGIMGRWKFQVDAGSEQTFVISNVAINPVESAAQDVLIEATTSFWDSSLTNPRQQAPSGRTSAQTGPPGTRASGDATRSEGQRNLETGLNSLSNRTSSGTQVSHSPDLPNCAKPFAESGCGPVTTINLALMPGAFADLTMMGGTGGGLAQVMSQFVAIADKGAFATDRALKGAMQEIADTEGSTVTITLPFIDYGFTGSFSNAGIQVNGGKGKDKLEAVGPRDSQVGRGRLYPQAGKVTITHYTPYLLSGNFEGSLTDLSVVDFAEFGDDTPLPVHRTISGSFAIAAPWEGDPRVSTYTPEGGDPEAGLQDLYETFPAMRNFDLEALKAMRPSALEGSGDAAALSSSAVGIFPACSCGCRIDREQARECLKICKPAIVACGQQKQLDQRINQALGKAGALENDVARMRQDYENYLRAANLDENHLQSLLAVFDQQPSAEEKLRMLMAEGLNVGSYGDRETQRGSANPDRPTREEYIAGLIKEGIPPAQIENLVQMMDEFMAENGGWPTE